MTMTRDALADLQSFTQSSEAWFRDSLRTLVEHATISLGGEHERDIRAGAQAACALIEAAGGRAELVETGGTPTVLGAFDHPAPKVQIAVYNHLDVQPADPASWTQGTPFTMGVEDHPEREVIYWGRGTTDDKGPALCALRAAAYAASQKLPIGIRLIWESEEEIGSKHLREAVAAKRDELDVDAIIVSDTIWPSSDRPAISTGLRGALQAVLKLRTAHKQAHSGLTGGVARNPIRELCAVATAIHRASFWHEGVLPPSPSELASFAEAGFDPEYFRRSMGLERLESDVPLEMLLRLWARPTFEVHGIAGGYTGPGVMTVVPDQAELKASFRLVPEQDPDAIAEHLHGFVRALNPDVEVDAPARLHPYRAQIEGKVHEALRRAIHAAFGRQPVLVREGGSIGAVPILAEMLGAPVHFLPLSLPEHGYHAPDENFDWRQARGGIAAFAHTFALLAAG